MIRRLALPLSLILLLALCLPMFAVDKRAADKRMPSPEWPQWRGPHRDNLSTDKGLLDAWPSDGPTLAWKATGLGAGFSGVSISHGRIYTMGDLGKDECVIALDMGGNKLWTTPIGKAGSPGGYVGPRCTPAIDGDLLYAIDIEGDLACLKTANGKEVWRKSFPKDFGGKMHSHWGFSESPLVDHDKVICTPGGPTAGLVALNKKNGKEIWRCEIPNLGDKGGDGAAYSSIVIGNGGGVRQYVQLTGRGVVGVSDDGRFLWGYNRIANGTANIPTPLVQGDYVFCSTGYGTGAALLKLTGSGSEVKADEVYFLNAKDLQNHHGGMFMLGDYVYCGHGHKLGAPTCLNWKTGKIVWREPRGPGAGSAAVCYADGNMYFRYEDGLMTLMGATPDGYKLKGSFKIPDCNAPSWPHPVVVGGMLYLREQDNLFCYDVRK
jgi:outer membrane protein assembly factor BamB